MAARSTNARAAEDRELDVDYSERAGFLTGKAAALADWSHRKEETEYRKLFQRLASRNYARRLRATDPERARALCRAWRQRNPERARMLDRQQKIRRYKPRECRCRECGRTWRTKRGERRASFCGRACANRYHGKRRPYRYAGIRYMTIAEDARAVLAREPWLTARELHARLPRAKFGSLATLLSTWTKRGELVQQKECRGTRYALRSTPTPSQEKKS